MAKGKYIRRPWSEAEEAVLRAKYANTPSIDIAKEIGRRLTQVYQHANKLGLQKSAEYIATECRFNGQHPHSIGKRFTKGLVPFNKGLRRPGYAPGRMAQTQFKKGQHPHTWMPIGSTRYSKEGYLQRKIQDTGYPPADWKGVHLILWEEANGAIPPGHAVCFKDRDRTNIVIENLELITRRDLMLRNTLHRFPKELTRAIQMVGALHRQIRKKEKKANAKEHDERSPQPPLRNARSAQG
jgi:hypothetical protein